MISRTRLVFTAGLYFILILFPWTLIANSFPTPGRKADSSLLGIPTRIDPESGNLKATDIIIRGPRRHKMKVSTEEWDIRWFRVSPGSYHLDIGNDDSVIDVLPGIIMVAPVRIVLFSLEGESALRLEPVDEEDRQKAALNLALFYDFPEWQGRDYIGFGSLRPSVKQVQSLFEATITSNPQGAEIFFDDRLVGTSPLTLTLEGGKHKLLFRGEGREDVTRYIRLEGDADILVELPPAVGSVSEQETYKTLIGSFYPVGETDEQINALFVDTLELVLEDDPRFNLVRSEIPWKHTGTLSQPDFSLLEETGADLVVSGTFLKQGNYLVVQANLYDIQAESVKTGTFWTGDVGLSIFDAMDLIAEKFIGEVDRVLPVAGRVLITRTEIVYGALSDQEQGVNRKQMINRRWQEYPDSLSIQAGIGGAKDEDYILSTRTPPIAVAAEWSRDVSSLWQAGAGGIYYIIPERPGLEIEAHSGVRLMFRTLRTDISFGLSGSIQYTPQFSDIWSGENYGSFLSVGLPIDIRFYYYFTDKVDRNPVYFMGNMAFSFLGYRFDLSGREQHGFISISGLIAFGVGIRL